MLTGMPYVKDKINNKKWFWRLLCGHKFSPNYYHDANKCKHYYVCIKCGKKQYID